MTDESSFFRINTVALASIATILMMLGGIFVFWNIRERQLWMISERYENVMKTIDRIEDKTSDIRDIHKGLAGVMADLSTRVTHLEGRIEEQRKNNHQSDIPPAPTP